MIATIDGITVMGTPEEIQKFREITSKTKTTTNWYEKGGQPISIQIDAKNIANTVRDYMISEDLRRRISY